MMKKNEGFTLIELLVTISIIGLLSSVVFTSLGSARTKAKDAAIKQEVGEMQKLIEQSFVNGNYSNYYETGLWIGDYIKKDCSNLGGDMVLEAKKICAAIYKIGVGDFGNPNNPNEFLMGILEYSTSGDWLPYKGVRLDLYSISVGLNSGNFYCVSNIGIYEGPNPWGANNPCFYYRTP